MWIIDLTPVEPGVYCDHRGDHITEPPEGWAVIPDDFIVPHTFPRLGSIKARNVGGVMTVTDMTEGTLPEPVEPEPPETEDSVWDELDRAYQEGVDSV